MTSNDLPIGRFYHAIDIERAQQKRLDQFLLELVGIADTLYDLSLHCAELERKGIEGLPRRSVEVVRRRLLAALKSQQVEPMNCKGQPLDLARHEVIEVKDVRGTADDIVLAETVPGYMEGDRVLRHAKVIISRARPIPKRPSKRAKRRRRGHEHSP
jgi:molecular chaperone GrpE